MAVVVLLGSVMTILDSTIVSVALADLGRSFKVSVTTVQWVTTGYLLALALVIPLSRFAADAFGAKRAWLCSLGLFLAGSMLCGLAWSALSLICFRVLQGLGGGMVVPIGQAVLARQAGPERMGRVMSIAGAPTFLGPILGPVAGGLILSHFSWRFIFFVNVPLGVIALTLASRILPRAQAGPRPPLDVVGLCLVSPGLSLVVVGLASVGDAGGFSNLATLVTLPLGLVLLAGFVARQLGAAKPLLELRLFAVRDYRVACVCSALVSASVYATMLLLPLYYQVVRQQSPLRAALLMIPQSFGAMLMTPFAGTICDRAGPRRVAACGLAVMAAGTAVFTGVTATTNEGVLFLAQLVRGLGFGLAYVPLQAAAYRLDRRLLPSATTLYNIVQRTGSTFATALVAVLLQRRLSATVPGFRLGETAVVHEIGLLQHIAAAFGSAYFANVAFLVLAFAGALLLSGRSAAGRPGSGEPLGLAPVPEG